MNKKRTHEDIRRAAAPAYRLALLPGLVMAAMGCANTAWAVDGGVIAAGAGSIRTQGNKTTISQSSDKMVVNWKNFNIGSDQTVVVNQPGATSAVLNRVVTASPTQIDGTLKANGRVFVVNPSGVVFGTGAKVNVGSLIATTLDTTDQHFMDGGKVVNKTSYLNFSAKGGEGKVINNGHISADDAAILVGPQVANYGTIRAKDISLAAVNGVSMGLINSNLVILLGKQAENALAENYGVLTAKGGDVNLSAAATGAVLATVVRNKGDIEATSVTPGKGGNIILSSKDGGKISVDGRLTADGGIGVRSYGRGGFPMGSDVDFVESSAPLVVYSTPASHDVTVEPGARLKAKGSVSFTSDGGHLEMNGLINSGREVYLDSTVLAYGDMGPETMDGVITTNGKINADSVQLWSANINVNAPIKAANSVYIESYGGDVNQRANITSSNKGVTIFSGGNIIQADGVKTSAGTDVYLGNDWNWLAYQSPAHDIRAANIQAKTISIAGGDVTLAGNLKADGNVSVRATQYKPPCFGEACTAVMAGGHIKQSGNVVSTNGNVALEATSSITQQAKSRTSANNVVTLKSYAVDTGKIDAGKKINVNATVAQLGGKLTAPEISLPGDAQNTKGKVSTRPDAASL